MSEASTSPGGPTSVRKRPPLARLGALIAACVATALWLAAPSRAGSPAGPAARELDTAPVTDTVTVGSGPALDTVPAGFLGLAFEFQSIGVDAGSPSAPDTVLERLIANLDPGQRPVIRIGGDSTDHSYVADGRPVSPGLKFALTRDWLDSVAQFATATRAHLILGIDLEMNDPARAGLEARTLRSAMPAGSIADWEIGNEPNLYPVFPWYVKVQDDPSTGVFTETHAYTVATYLAQVAATAKRLPELPIAGPALGPSAWLDQLPAILRAEPKLNTVTYHAYPLNCYVGPSSPEYPTLANLLSPRASTGLAAGVAPYVAEAHAVHRTFRVDEMNSSSCGGETGVSNTFGSALWMTDALFALAERGVDGVNVQTFNSSRYKPFALSQVDGHWVATVEPDYYGMLLFSLAAPAGSQLLATRSSGAAPVQAFAARTPRASIAAGAETVTLTNDSRRHSETVRVRAAGTDGGTLERLLAPSASATGDVSLDGTSYGASTSTGTLTGTPDTAGLSGSGTYEVTLAPASAALLDLRRG